MTKWQFFRASEDTLTETKKAAPPEAARRRPSKSNLAVVGSGNLRSGPHFAAISFSISSGSRGTRRVRTSAPSGVIRIRSSIRTPSFSSGI